jgi:DNA mismatch repair protein MutS
MTFLDLDKHPYDINELALINQYDYYFKYYRTIYPKSTIMFQNGSFYEFYGTEDGRIGNVAEIANLTLMNIGHQTNYIFVGFQINSKSKYLEKLLEHGWTVVQIDQERTKEERKKFKRGVTVIHSPETYISDNITPDNKFIVCCFVEYFTDPQFDPVLVGLSAIDVTTGEIKIYETGNDKDDQDFAINEITHFIQSHSTVCTLFYSEHKVDGYSNSIKWDQKYTSPNYQTKFLETLYPSRGMLSIHEYLGTTRFTTATASFVALANYCLDHNPGLLTNLSPPTIYSNDSCLMLANNAIEQLDLVSSAKNKTASVFNLINFTNTAMGHRLLRNRLLYPITNPEEINRRYDYVEVFWDWEKYSKILKKICDLEKIYRKMSSTISIQFIQMFVSSILRVERLSESVGDQFTKIKGLTKLIDFINTNIDQTKQTFFINERLVQLEEEKKECLAFFNKQKEKFQDIINSTIEINITEEQGCLFKLSNSKYSMLRDQMIIVNSNKTYKHCTTEKIKEISEKYSIACQEYDQIYKKALSDFVTGILSFDKIIKRAIDYVANVDVYVSSAKCAQQYNYSRPIVRAGKSFIKTRQIRHPLIERICDSIYTPHDLVFDQKTNGMLLYGFNASGKSSLMKTIGINLILAQAGMFTASTSFKFAPFTNIQTRIISTDNLQKGLSSFAVEMSELRSILARANESSLILGDEISRGTETVSGVAIVSSAILHLLSKGSKFLFATHLHQLCDIEEIKKSDNLAIFHLQVERDRKTGVLIYKRELQPGCGDSLYGLEVARAMKLPDEFMVVANKIRKRLIGEREPLSRPSHFNPEMFLEICGVCGETAMEVHHIKFQKDADENGFIGWHHKNHLRNLVGLCESCHHKVHQKKLKISGWQETSDGFKLEFH